MHPWYQMKKTVSLKKGKSIIRTTIHIVIIYNSINLQYLTITDRLELLSYWNPLSFAQPGQRQAVPPSHPVCEVNWDRSPWSPPTCLAGRLSAPELLGRAGLGRGAAPSIPSLWSPQTSKITPCQHMEAISQWGEGQIQLSEHWLQAHSFSQRPKKKKVYLNP